MNEPTENLRDWPTTMANWRRSGLTQAAFCRRENIKPHLFTYYKLKLEGKAPVKPSGPLPNRGFTQIAVAHSTNHSGLQVTLVNGTAISGIQASNLPIVTELLRLLK